MDKQLRKRFPEQCLFMNANGEIMSIEYGKSGFRRFELSTENKIANREIINSYNKRHGVTSEQVKMMHRGALLGWDAIEPTEQEKCGVKKGMIFEVEIACPDSFGVCTASTLTLPATPYEVLDAMDRALITDGRLLTVSEIINCELDYMPQLIDPNTNLHELNHLSHRLSSLNQWELDCFEGMVMMDAVQTQWMLCR